jgi:hypothetical protein
MTLEDKVGIAAVVFLAMWCLLDWMTLDWDAEFERAREMNSTAMMDAQWWHGEAQ